MRTLQKIRTSSWYIRKIRLSYIGMKNLQLALCFLGLGPGLFIYLFWRLADETAIKGDTPGIWLLATLSVAICLSGTFGFALVAAKLVRDAITTMQEIWNFSRRATERCCSHR